MKKNELNAHWRAEVIDANLSTDDYVASLFPMQRVERISTTEYHINGDIILECHKSNYSEVKEHYQFNLFSPERKSHLVLNLLVFPGDRYLSWIYHREEVENLVTMTEFLSKIPESSSFHAFEKLDLWSDKDKTRDTILFPTNFNEKIAPHLPLKNLTTPQRKNLYIRSMIKALGNDFLNFREILEDSPIGHSGINGNYVAFHEDKPYLVFLTMTPSKFNEIREELFPSIKHVVLIEGSYFIFHRFDDGEWSKDYEMDLEKYNHSDWRFLKLFQRSNFQADKNLYDDHKIITLNQLSIDDVVKETTEEQLMWFTDLYDGDVRRASVEMIQMIKKHLRPLVKQIGSELSFEDLDSQISEMKAIVEQEECEQVEEEKRHAIQFEVDEQVHEKLDLETEQKVEYKTYCILGESFSYRYKYEVLARSIQQFVLLRASKTADVYEFVEAFANEEFTSEWMPNEDEALLVVDNLYLFKGVHEERCAKIIEDFKLYFNLDSFDIYQKS